MSTVGGGGGQKGAISSIIFYCREIKLSPPPPANSTYQLNILWHNGGSFQIDGTRIPYHPQREEDSLFLSLSLSLKR